MFGLLQQGDQVGGYVFLVDAEGLRHALRPNSVLIISDSDVSQDETVLQIGAGRVIRIVAPLERVLSWLGMGQHRRPTPATALDGPAQ